MQAVNYFDFVTQDGHGLKTYFSFILFNFPKIIHRIIPFIFFISLFYILINYEIRNELSIFWMNGITKIDFTNKVIFLSVLLMIKFEIDKLSMNNSTIFLLLILEINLVIVSVFV